jgi:hypothetical protein
LILTGKADALVPHHDNVTAYYNGLVASKHILDISRGDHNLGVGIFDFNTNCTAATLKYVTGWFDATLKSNSTVTSLFTSPYLKCDSEVDIYQLDIKPLSPAPSGDGNSDGGKSNHDVVMA